jgi:hypothetical protein
MGDRTAPLHFFTKIVFWIAAIYGFILLIPMYFLMNTIGQEPPPRGQPSACCYLLRCRLVAQKIPFAENSL